MPDSRTKFTKEFRIETADYIISTERPIAQVTQESDINAKQLLDE